MKKLSRENHAEVITRWATVLREKIAQATQDFYPSDILICAFRNLENYIADFSRGKRHITRESIIKIFNHVNNLLADEIKFQERVI